MSITSTVTVALCVVSLLASSGAPAVHVTDSVFADSTASALNQFAGASFVPNIAPSVTVVHGSSSTTLTWPPVVFTGGGSVAYVVRRISPNGSTIVVCSGADAPVLTSGGVMGCVDAGSGGRRNLSYSQQPVVLRDGTETWSLSPSIPTRGT